MSIHFPFRHHNNNDQCNKEALLRMAEREIKEAKLARDIVELSVSLEQKAIDYLISKKPSRLTFDRYNPITIQQLSGGHNPLIITGVHREEAPNSKGCISKITEFAIVHYLDGGKKLSVSQKRINGHLVSGSGYYEILPPEDQVSFYCMGIDGKHSEHSLSSQDNIVSNSSDEEYKPVEFTGYPILNIRSLKTYEMLEPLVDVIENSF